MSAVGVAGEVAVALEPFQRLAHRRAAGAELGGELLLDEPVPDRNLTARQPVPELFVDEVGVGGAGRHADKDAQRCRGGSGPTQLALKFVHRAIPAAARARRILRRVHPLSTALYTTLAGGR